MKQVADRYAGALLDVAIAHGQTEAVKPALDSFGATISESSELRQFLANPAVPKEKRVAVMETLLDRIGAPADARTMLRNFVRVVVDHRRGALLPQIAESYTQKMHERLGIAVAQVSSAAELNERERLELERAFARVTNMKIEARYAVESGLVGGAVVRIGSTIYDGSVKEQLKRMEEKLAGE